MCMYKKGQAHIFTITFSACVHWSPSNDTHDCTVLKSPCLWHCLSTYLYMMNDFYTLNYKHTESSEGVNNFMYSNAGNIDVSEFIAQYYISYKNYD